MRVISRKRLKEFCEGHPDAKDAREPLDVWFRTAERADWRKYADLKAVYASAEVMGKYTVVNLCGNKYRLILEIFYESAVVLIRHVLTHKEYDTNLGRGDAHEPTPRRAKKPEPQKSQARGKRPQKEG